jgi:hypothetical protein
LLCVARLNNILDAHHHSLGFIQMREFVEMFQAEAGKLKQA